MGEGPIPVTAVITYGQYHQCDYEMMDDLIYFVNLLDEAYLKDRAKKSKMK